MQTLRDYVNWGLTHCDKTASAEGVPLVMEKCAKNKRMKQLEVYGNSVQNGTPTPENPIEVESVGEKCTKNLYDAETYPMVDGYYIAAANGAYYKSSNGYICATAEFIPCEKMRGITYTINYVKSWSGGIAFYDADKTFVSGIAYHKDAQTIPFTFIVPDDAFYFRFSSVNSHIGEIQIEEGSTATEYEPYGKYKLPVVVRGKNLIPFSNSLANNYSEYSVSGTSYTIRGNVGAGRFQATTGQLMFPSLYNIETYGMEVTAGKTYRITFDYLLKELGAYDSHISLIIYGTSNAVRLNKNGYVKGVVGETISYNFSFTSEYNEKVCLCFRINNNLVTLSDIRFEDADVEPITTTVYLNEPLGLDRYIDFKDKKIYSLNGSEEAIDCELPMLIAQTTIIDVDTNVKPSNIKGKYIKR